MFKHILFLIMLEDFMFYWIHRMMHIKHKYLPLYQTFHKYHHEFKDTVSISASYSPPPEYALANNMPFFAGPIFLGSKFHFTTFYLWAILRALEAADSHSGYEFPWNPIRLLPFSGDATHHQFHHKKNVGNFGTFTYIWDTLFNTSTEFYKSYPEGARPEYVAA